jgi:hypothetical protein
MPHKENDSIKQPDNNSSSSNIKGIPISSTSVPVIIKKDAWRRNALLCQVDDPKLNIVGDSGAVGRIKANTSSGLVIDIKGRQYEGKIMSGPTVLLLNLAPPVAAKTVVKETARAELVTNEFVHLTFKKDILSSMMGEYTFGDSDADGDSIQGGDGSIASDNGLTKSAQKKKQPIISNVMNRKRKVSSKKGSSMKKRK